MQASIAAGLSCPVASEILLDRYLCVLEQKEGLGKPGVLWPFAFHFPLQLSHTFPTHHICISFKTLTQMRDKTSFFLAWRITGTGEPGGLPSLGSHRVGHG